MMRVLGALIAAATAVTAADGETRRVSVWAKDGKVTAFASGELAAGATAVAEFEDTLLEKGWGILDVKATGAHADADMAYAAGVAEGYLTGSRIKDHYANMYQAHFKGTAEQDVSKVAAWLDEQYHFAKDQAAANKGSLFWRQLGNVMQQFDGLRDGYNRWAEDNGEAALGVFAFNVLNGDGDLFQITPAVLEHKRAQWDKMTNQEAEIHLANSGKCSSIIKVTSDFSDLFMGHSSWYTYSATNRIFKHYFLDYADDVAAKKVSFSSYPGYLESLDDFYMMDSGLGMVQTSISFTDDRFYDLITPKSLLAWQRVRAASVIAKDGEAWHAAVSTNHSGTYCNQYMIVDYNKFEKGQPLKPGTLWVMEEIPGQLPGADLTDVLAYGYWPSYNVPFFDQIYKASGMEALAARGVPSASYQTAPRAEIFRRDSEKVVDLDSYAALLRFNEYKTDPLSGGNACNSICCRGDLRVDGAKNSGCYDTKVTSADNFKSLTAKVINGPTTGGNNEIPVYEWQEADEDHRGLPARYNFPWIWTSAKKL